MSSEAKPSGSQQVKITPEKSEKREKKSKDSSKERDIKKRIKEVSPKALVKKLSLITDGKKNKEKKKAKADRKAGGGSELSRSDSSISKETICSIDAVSFVETDPSAASSPKEKKDDVSSIDSSKIETTSETSSKESKSSPVSPEINSPAPGASAPPPTPRIADGTSLDDIPSMEFLSAHEANVGTKRECLYKILVIGELGTGKTSIIKRYVHQFFSQHYRATIGVDFALKVLNWDQNTIIRLQLWDIAGQERFGNMTRVYYKEAVGAFIVFDVTRASTFEAIVKWKLDLDAKVQLPDGSPIPCVLLANKCDQQKEGLVNQPNKMTEYCNEHKFTGWFETSAKENINIEEAAKLLISQILNNDVTTENGSSSNDPNRIALDGKSDDVQQKSCSC